MEEMERSLLRDNRSLRFKVDWNGIWTTAKPALCCGLLMSASKRPAHADALRGSSAVNARDQSAMVGGPAVTHSRR